MPLKIPESEVAEGWSRFPGGINLIDAPSEMDPGDLEDSVNLILTKSNRLQGRRGMEKFNIDTLNTSEHFTHLADFYLRSGSTFTNHFIGFTNQGRVIRIEADNTYTEKATGFANDLS